VSIILRICIASMLLVVTGCVSFYTHKPIGVKIVDESTGEPIEGVIGVAVWTAAQPLGGWGGVLNVVEVVSDEYGRIRFPAWGPVMATNRFLDYRGAQISLYKPGYNIPHYSNPIDGDLADWRAKHPNRSPYDGKTIRMRKFEGSLSEYIEEVKYYDRNLNKIRWGENCEWQKIPLTLVALHKFSEELDQRAKKIHTRITGKEIKKLSDIDIVPHCASPEKFFEVYMGNQLPHPEKEPVKVIILKPNLFTEEINR